MKKKFEFETVKIMCLQFPSLLAHWDGRFKKKDVLIFVEAPIYANTQIQYTYTTAS